MGKPVRDLLNQVPPIIGFTFDPLKLIQSANGLYPCGKDRILRAVTDYVHQHQAPEISRLFGVSLLLWCLFEVPNQLGSFPSLEIGMPIYLREPEDRRIAPRFPLILCEDIPLLVTEGILFAVTFPGSPLRHVDFCRRFCRLRRQPLTPGVDPLRVIDRIEATPGCLWTKPYEAVNDGISPRFSEVSEGRARRMRSMLRLQLLRLIKDAYPLPRDVAHKVASYGDISDRDWQQIVAEVSRLDLRWDEGANRYRRHH